MLIPLVLFSFFTSFTQSEWNVKVGYFQNVKPQASPLAAYRVGLIKNWWIFNDVGLYASANYMQLRNRSTEYFIHSEEDIRFQGIEHYDFMNLGFGCRIRFWKKWNFDIGMSIAKNIGGYKQGVQSLSKYSNSGGYVLQSTKVDSNSVQILGGADFRLMYRLWSRKKLSLSTIIYAGLWTNEYDNFNIPLSIGVSLNLDCPQKVKIVE